MMTDLVIALRSGVGDFRYVTAVPHRVHQKKATLNVPSQMVFPFQKGY